jgi:hypothetical protein
MDDVFFQQLAELNGQLFHSGLYLPKVDWYE